MNLIICIVDLLDACLKVFYGSKSTNSCRLILATNAPACSEVQVMEGNH